MKQLADKIARVLGYVDFPTDSIEQGNTWHKDAEKAPHGPTVYKSHFERDLLTSGSIMYLIEQFSIEFKWVTDATLEVHSVIADKTIYTTNGYAMGVLECLAS